MSLTVPILESRTRPWPFWTLNLAYLWSGLVIAAHYRFGIRKSEAK
jgi:hypothetical protein